MRRVIMVALAAFAVISAQADSTSVSGTIRRLDSTTALGGAPGNGDIRVYLNNVTSFCSGAVDPSWAFFNANDANFKGAMATLSLAYATGKSVTIWSQPQPIGSNGNFCEITWINVIG